MAKDRAHDPRRTPDIEQERFQGKYAYELTHPTKYEHEESKADKAANDESLFATEGRIPESWTEK